MSTSVSHVACRIRNWRIAIVLALAPLWIVAILDRGLWTPDEPREADIAWRMSQDRTLLPQLANTPFLEKPPLTYWMSAAGITAFNQPRAANLLYALITALAVGALAVVMMDTGAAFLSALLVGTTLIAFRASVWLAPDACLLAGSAIALWGAYTGYVAAPGRCKLRGYTLMHVGAALGFMAKSAPGWLVPALALLTLIAWERKWSELRRPELYAGILLQALLIGPWVYAVAVSPQGHDALLALFWHNVVGRFTKVSGPSALDYTTGHPNWPGKYFLELPVYLLPWTLLAIAACRRAWTHIDETRWRFAIAATLPFLLVLSVAATARDIYAAPAMVGASLLITLWAVDAQNNMRRIDRFALRGTRAVVAVIALVFAGFLIFLGGKVQVVAAIGTLIVAAVALLFAAREQRLSNVRSSVICTFIAYASTWCIAGLAAFPAVDEWQNLPLLARAIKAQTSGTSLGLLNPDETTLAMLDYRLRTPFTVLDTKGGDPGRVVSAWFRSHGKQSRVLVLLPGSARGDGMAGELSANGTASIIGRFELPRGRRYALLGPPLAAAETTAPPCGGAVDLRASQVA